MLHLKAEKDTQYSRLINAVSLVHDVLRAVEHAGGIIAHTLIDISP